MSNMAQQQQDQQSQQQQLEGIHKYKISPPRFNGEYSTFEEWKYKMTAYLGLQDPDYNRLLRQSEQSTGSVTNDQLENAAPSQQVAEQWIQLSNNLHYILVSTCDGPASTIGRQNMQGNGFETWRLIHARCSIPLGTRSIGYLTKLLTPQLDEQKFEDSFTTWEFQLSRYEQDNNRLLPDAIKIAVLLNETKGPLQQHLQLQAGNNAQTRSMVIEYYRATASFTRLQSITSGSNNNQGPAPMDTGATWYNKGKGKKGKHKGKGKHNKGKGYGGYGNNFGYNNYKGGKGKYNQQPVGQGNPFKGQQGYSKGKGYNNNNNKGKGKGYYSNQQGGKGSKGKQATNVCYRCGQPGHMAKQCRVAIYNCDTGNFDTNDQTDDWYSQSHYDNNWYHQDQTHMQQLALPQPPQMADPLAAPISGLQEVTIAMIGTAQQHSEDNKRVSLMIDSGAATHVCPPWFAPHFPLHKLEHGTGPQLTSSFMGNKWVCMTNHSAQQIVIPFCVCEVKQPILSVTRLVEQGFQLTLDDNPKLHHIKGFNSTLDSRNGLFFLQAETTALPKGTKLQIHNTDQQQIGMIAPTTTLTPQGPADTGYAGDYWQFNTQGELVRVHRQHRKTLFTPSRTAEQLEDYRKTTIRLKDGTTNTFEDKYQTMEVPNKAQPQMWKGETTFRIKKGTTLPEAIQQQLATKTQPKSAPQVIQYRPRTRLREKTTPPTVQDTPAPHTTKGAAGQGLPHPSEVHPGGDYWYREGPYWKRVHVEPRTAFYIREQTHDGPHIKRQHTRLIEDEWTTQPAKTSDKPWTGWTNFEEHQEFPTQLEQQQGIRAKAVQAPKQPTPQEILEHNVTHLPYRSWCPICVQSRGRPKTAQQASNHTTRLWLHQRLR